MAATSAQSRALADINMTPLIDVMLVLLIIFIITLPRHTHAIKIDNPTVSASPPPPVVAVTIDFDGMIRWNHEPVDRGALQGHIAEAAAKFLQPAVHLSVDKFAKYAIVAQTLADLQSRGLKSIGFINHEP